MERRIRELNRFTVGWTAYFAYADTPRPFADLDEWLRRRLRQVRWKEWKRYRTRRRNLRALGIPERAGREWAGSRKGYGRIAGPAPLQRALPNVYWSDLGLAGFSDPYRRFRMRREPPDADPHVRWCGRGRGEPGPYPIREEREDGLLRRCGALAFDEQAGHERTGCSGGVDRGSAVDAGGGVSDHERVSGSGRLDSQDGRRGHVGDAAADPHILAVRPERHENLLDTERMGRRSVERSSRDDPRFLLRELEHRDGDEYGGVEVGVLLERPDSGLTHESLGVQ
jgi:hypothetical protein